MKQLFVAWFSGLLFAVGLGIAGMTRPDKVIAFLDVAGDWDPSLAFVMIGAIGVHFVFYRLVLQREAPLLGERFRIPRRQDITPRLLGGAALFGIGWAIGGYCPGPALVSVTSLSVPAVVFALSLTAGMVGFHLVEAWFDRATTKPLGGFDPAATRGLPGGLPRRDP